MTENWFNSVENVLDHVRLRSLLGRQFLAELIGTFMLVMIGDGAIAQRQFFGNDTGAGFLNVNIGYAFALMLGVYFTASVSGGHLNPAVSLALCTLGQMKWIALPVYALAQLIGAFLGAVTVFAVYYDTINKIDGGNRTAFGPTGTAGIFATYPAEGVTMGAGFLDQVVGTAILVAGIMAVTDKKNSKPPSGLEPLFVGLTFFAVGISFGYNYGYGINPARDFGPRLFTAIAGYGPDIWAPGGMQWWWIPIVGPLVGGPLGGWIYYLMVSMHIDTSYNKHTDERQVSEMGSHQRDEGQQVCKSNL
ncbi:aquaporin-3-like isoform X2 [Asterias amurensis]